MFIEYLEKWVDENAERLTEKNIKVEHVLNYEGEKIELGLSNMNNNNGASLDILIDGTCDSMIISYETDETLFYETVLFTNTDELTKYFNYFVFRLAQ